MPSDRIGKFRTIETLGRGGMGEVWKAEDTATGRVVALKVLPSGTLQDSEARQRLRLEALAAARLKHEHIATLWEANFEETPHIAFEFIEGETIAERCRHAPLPVADALRIAIDTAGALTYAHASGVLHRDIKSSNVMIRTDGRAIVVDFGLATITDVTRVTRPGEILLTLPYAPPEILRGEDADVRSDLYSLGVVLFEMLTGVLPFRTTRDDSLMYQILSVTPDPPSQHRGEVPADVDALVGRLLSKEPDRRFQSADELAAALRTALDRVTSGAAPGALERARRRMLRWARSARGLPQTLGGEIRRRPVTSTASGIVVLAAGTALAVHDGWIPPPTRWFANEYRSIAVLRLKSVAADSTAMYFNEALGPEITTRLSAIGKLRVTPWSVTGVISPATAPQFVGRDLDVEALVTGSLTVTSDSLRVGIELVDAGKGRLIWARVYGCGKAELFDLQARIAADLADHVLRIVDPRARSALTRAPSSSPVAYDHYLRGAAQMQLQTLESVHFAEQQFRKALEIDPDLAEADVGLGAVLLDLYFRGEAGQEQLDQAERYFRRALELRPGDPRATRGLITLAYERGEAKRGLEIAATAARSMPDGVETDLMRAWAYLLCGLPDQAVPVLEHVIDEAPGRHDAAWMLSIAYAWAGRSEESIAASRKYVRRFGEDPEIYTWLGVTLAAQGEDELAGVAFDRAIELFGDASNLYVIIYASSFLEAGGHPDRSVALCEKWIPVLERKAERYPDNFRAGALLTGLYARAGKSSDVIREGQRLLALLEQPRPQGGQELLLMFAAVSSTHDARLIQQVHEQLIRRDCAIWTIPLARLALGEQALQDPEFQQLIRRIQLRQAELRNQFGSRPS